VGTGVWGAAAFGGGLPPYTRQICCAVRVTRGYANALGCALTEARYPAQKRLTQWSRRSSSDPGASARAASSLAPCLFARRVDQCRGTRLCAFLTGRCAQRAWLAAMDQRNAMSEVLLHMLVASPSLMR